MKSKKCFKARPPWWAFDFIDENKGWWKIFYRKVERNKIKRDTLKQYKELS